MSLRLNNPKNSKGEYKYHQGYYKIKNVEKYVGDIVNCVFRSSWEKKFCTWCDLNPNILKWGSEIAVIPYIGPDQQQHRYHIDFYIETEGQNGINERTLIEVKPSNELYAPKKPEKLTAKALESYEYSIKAYQKNIYKWSAAKQYAQDRGMKFMIVTENHLSKIK